MCVKWDGIKSDNIACFNGVCQGSLLFPFLFSLCTDEILKDVLKFDVGYVGLEYAD